MTLTTFIRPRSQMFVEFVVIPVYANFQRYCDILYFVVAYLSLAHNWAHANISMLGVKCEGKGVGLGKSRDSWMEVAFNNNMFNNNMEEKFYFRTLTFCTSFSIHLLQ